MTSPLVDFIIFTDNWWNAFIHEYAYTLGLLYALLKAIAVLDPSNKTNKIIDSFCSFLPGRAQKELARRETDKPKQ